MLTVYSVWNAEHRVGTTPLHFTTVKGAAAAARKYRDDQGLASGGEIIRSTVTTQEDLLDVLNETGGERSTVVATIGGAR